MWKRSSFPEVPDGVFEAAQLPDQVFTSEFDTFYVVRSDDFFDDAFFACLDTLIAGLKLSVIVIAPAYERLIDGVEIDRLLRFGQGEPWGPVFERVRGEGEGPNRQLRYTFRRILFFCEALSLCGYVDRDFELAILAVRRDVDLNVEACHRWPTRPMSMGAAVSLLLPSIWPEGVPTVVRTTLIENYGGGEEYRAHLKSVVKSVHAAANKVLDGTLDPIDGSVEIRSIYRLLEPECFEYFRIFDRVESETARFPRGEAKHHWAPELLATWRPEIDKYLATNGMEIKEACRNVLSADLRNDGLLG